MKLIPVNYFGYTAIDKRFSSPMLPWIVAEIRKRTSTDKLSLGVEDGHLQAYDKDFELQFSHKILNMTRFSQADFDPCIFLYLLRDDVEQLLYCYLFQARRGTDVTDLYQQMKDQNNSNQSLNIININNNINNNKSSLSNATNNLTSLCGDISPSSSNFFEVLYIGKIKVWRKKVPDTFIDDALIKFKDHDLEKRAKKLQRLKSETIIRRGSLDSAYDKNSNYPNIAPLIRSASTLSNSSLKSISDIDLRVPKAIDVDEINRINEDEENEDDPNGNHIRESTEEVQREPEPLQKSPSDSTIKDLGDADEHNRTMVLQVGRNDLRLISPDRKIILLHKQHRDVSTCVQGIINAEYFGFISREGNNVNTFIGFIFKCESKSVATEAVSAIRQAFANADSRTLRPTLTSCEHCPMVWFHKLCVEVENLSDRKTQATIFRKIEALDEEEQNIIMTKYRGAETDSLREQNEFLMMLLRAHCEMKQGKHVHDTAENRSEFLNQYLGGNTIFMKAKRSLSISFDHLLKRRGSKDDVNLANSMTLPVGTNRESSPYSTHADNSDRESDGYRSRSSTIGSQSDLKDYHHQSDRIPIEKSPKSPMMDIFLKIGNSPKISNMEECSPKQDTGSWRQAIFKRVVTPSKIQENVTQKRTTDELRQLWKKSIRQTILLVRMEKENAKLRARQEETAVKRIKLEYDEMKQNEKEILEMWEALTGKDFKLKWDNKMIHNAIKQGIPRVKRGEVWQMLAEDFCSKIPPMDLRKCPNYHVPYESLLKQLTSHQHAILIDLGRTFPSHSYFSSPLGPGQLALFNLLKAYSLLDQEVGYCQGLSFVAGVLLLHMSESQAFFMLRHLMFRRGLRIQYLPDMIGLQIKLYQLSRLIHDQLPDLYEHFDVYDVTPTLYAAPWLLTLFASQFPLGFVTRVFDMIFTENTNVIFKVALALLSYHRDNLLKCENFEEIMSYLKTTMTAINTHSLDQIMKHVNTIDISKQLDEYQVEYQVLQEEIQSVQPKDDAINKLENENRILMNRLQQLETQNKSVSSQLEHALLNVQRLEKLRATQQGTINKLELHSRGMDVTVSTLALFVNNLIESKIDVEIPGEVRRILSQYTFFEHTTDSYGKKEDKSKNLMNIFKRTDTSPPKTCNPDKLMIKSLSTGIITSNNNDNVMRTYSLNANYNDKHHNNNFFSNSHMNILNEKMKSDDWKNRNSNVQVDDVTSGTCSSSMLENGFTREIDNKKLLMDNNVSLPLKENRIDIPTKSSPTLSIDSGIVTPSSPKDTNNHPLSNCDIEFIYNGTRELKNIRKLKHFTKNSSPDI